MEHEEIVLNQKTNLRGKGTRFGMRSKNFIRHNWYTDKKYRQYPGLITDETTPEDGISLSKRKNWEILSANYDPESGVRIVEGFEDEIDPWIYYRVKKESSPKVPETILISGTNRKGFFVREKRRPGKRGVLRISEESGEDALAKSQNDPIERVICVSKRRKRQRAVDWLRGTRGCRCEWCLGTSKNQTNKNRNELREMTMDVNISPK